MKEGTIVGLCKQYVLLSCIWWAFYLIFQPSCKCLFLLKSFLCHMFYGLFQSEKDSPTQRQLNSMLLLLLHQLHLKLVRRTTLPSPMKTLSTNSFTSFKLIFCCVRTFFTRMCDSRKGENKFLLISKTKVSQILE